MIWTLIDGCYYRSIWTLIYSRYWMSKVCRSHTFFLILQVLEHHCRKPVWNDYECLVSNIELFGIPCCEATPQHLGRIWDCGSDLYVQLGIQYNALCDMLV